MQHYRIAQLADLPIFRIEVERTHWWRRPRWVPVMIESGIYRVIEEYPTLTFAYAALDKLKLEDEERMHRRTGCWVWVR